LVRNLFIFGVSCAAAQNAINRMAAKAYLMELSLRELSTLPTVAAL
jgi:hypothetical protein